MWLVISLTLAACDAGRISGLVLDHERRPLIEAAVTLRGEPLRGKALIRFSDRQGRYAFPNLPPGRYTISVEKEGFHRVMKNITLSEAERLEIDLVLPPKLIVR